MVSNFGSFRWMEGNDTHGITDAFRNPRPTTLWVTDQNGVVNPFLDRIEANSNHIVIRLRSQAFETPQRIVAMLQTWIDVCPIDALFLLGHYSFLSTSQQLELKASPDLSKGISKVSIGMLKTQRMNLLAQQFLLGTAAELSQLCAVDNNSAIRALKIIPLFFRCESSSLCYYEEASMRFQPMDV